MAKKQFNVETQLTAKIDDLTAKLNTANQCIDRFKKKANQGGGDQVFNSISGAALRFLPHISAATVAYNTFNGAVNNSRIAGDAWDLTVSGMQGSLEGFYTALGSGNWNSAISSMIRFRQAAEDLTRAMDTLATNQLGTSLAMSEIDLKITPLEIRLRDRNIGDDEFRQIAEELKELYEQRTDLLRKDSEDLLNNLSRNLEQKYGIQFNQLKSFLVNYREDENLRGLAEAYIQSEGKNISSEISRLRNELELLAERGLENTFQYSGMENQISQLEGLLDIGDDVKVYAAMLKRWGETTNEELEKVISAYTQLNQVEAQYLRDSERMNREYNRRNLSTPGKHRIPAILEVEDVDWDLNEKLEIIDSSPLIDMNNELRELQRLQARASSPEQWQELQVEIDRVNGEIKEFKGLVSDEDGIITEAFISYEDYLNNIASAYNSMAHAARSFNNDTLAGIFDTIAAFAQLGAAIETMNAIQSKNAITGAVASGAKVPFPGNLIAISAGVAAVMSALASIPKFATGGIVPGNLYSGDKVLAGLNSGEMVLNKGQQANLFKMLNNGGSGGGNVSFEIQGDKLVGVLNNHSRKTNSIG